MIDDIVKSLNKRKELAGWTVQHIVDRGAQVYAVPKGVEARRAVVNEQYKISVVCNTQAADGSAAMGDGDSTLLPGGDIEAAIDTAAAVAAAVTNPPYSLPGPANFPDVPLVDADIKKDCSAAVDSIDAALRAAASKHKGVEMTSAEVFGDYVETRLVNSRGIDAQQEETRIHVEFVLQGHKGERNSEMFKEADSRRIGDLHLDEMLEERARYTRDLLVSEAPPKWQGPVVLRRDVLNDFIVAEDLSPSPFRVLGSAASKYSKISTWEVGKSVFRDEVKGDPFSLCADRTTAYGVASNRFDAEGVPAQRVELIRVNKLVAFQASQRYADYLKVPATGDYGQLEVPAGKTPTADLLQEPYVEVCMFSWFNPDIVSGDFATEIRLGYLVKDGKATPFKGGQLIGNVLSGLANCRWSRETASFGRYRGPVAVRFADLQVAGGG